MDTLRPSAAARPEGGATARPSTDPGRRPSISYNGPTFGGDPPTRRGSVRRRLLALSDTLARV